ncbi:glycosyltransferase [Flavobacteriales bacterium]|nr:glycosyltransferase [Flavobacteriales bacterium]
MTNQFPLVTVAHLCYNTGPLVIEAIKSVLANDYPNIQHLILDDCSTDDSYDQLLSFTQSVESNIKLLKNNTNQGINKSQNRLLTLASGKYYLLVGDDVMLPDKIKTDVDFLEKSPATTYAVISHGQIFTDNPAELSESLHGVNDQFHSSPALPPLALLESLFMRNWICAPTAMFVTNHLRTFKHPEDFFIEDYPYWVTNAIHGYTLGYRPQTSILYRRHSAALTMQHHHSLVALKISKDRIRCLLLIANHTDRKSDNPRIVRDGINILQYGDQDLQSWYINLVQSLKLRGVIYYSSKISLNPKWLRAAWYLSQFTQRV